MTYILIYTIYKENKRFYIVGVIKKIRIYTILYTIYKENIWFLADFFIINYNIIQIFLIRCYMVGVIQKYNIYISIFFILFVSLKKISIICYNLKFAYKNVILLVSLKDMSIIEEGYIDSKSNSLELLEILSLDFILI